MEKMYPRKAFKCSICDKEYENAMDRARCELACGKKLEEEAKKAAEAKKQVEKIADHAKVTEAFDTAYKLRDEYTKKHGVYIYTHNESIVNMNEFPTFAEVLDFLSDTFM